MNNRWSWLRRLRRASRRLCLESLERRLALTGSGEAVAFIPLDYGDAPTSTQSGFESSYPVLAADQGAAHRAIGPRLGANRSPSIDGQPDAAAMGDVGSNDGANFQPLNPLRFAFGENPESMRVADLNGDGWDDVITHNRATSDFSVLLGIGSAQFAAPYHFSVPGCGDPVDLELADLDQDGKLDAITGCHASHHVALLFGLGNGRFTAPVLVSLGGAKGPCAVLPVDLNADGNLDVVVASAASDSVTVLFGDGNRSFQPAASLRLPPGSFPNDVIAADLNRDGWLDLVTANLHAHTLSVLFSRGHGNFDRPLVIGLEGAVEPAQVATADLDGDGWLDILSANRGTHDLSLVPGGPGELFLRPERIWLNGAKPLDVLSLDLNEDGIPDIVTANDTTNDFSILLGLGDGRFHELPRLVPPTSSIPQKIAARDVDDDGHIDLVAANKFSHTVTVFFGDGTGLFEAVHRQPFAAGIKPSGFAIADFNGDGIRDVATVNTLSSDLAILIGNKDGTFAAPRYVAIDPGSEPQALAAGDINGDGFVDLATANRIPGTSSVLWGDGEGGFSLAQTLLLENGTEPTDVVLADLNGDAILDLAATTSTGNAVVIGLGRGGGLFLPPTRIPLPLGLRPVRLISVDLNHDDRVDLVTANEQGGNLSILLGRGDGNFDLSLAAVGANTEPRDVVVGDFDGDGVIDLATANHSAKDVSLLRGMGNGKFHSPSSTAMPPNVVPTSLAAGDLNLDGFADLAVQSKSGDKITLLYGKGDGSFEAPEQEGFGLSSFDAEVALADMDDNGRLDVVSVTNRTEEVTVLLNEEDGKFVKRSVRLGQITLHSPLLPGDVNRDGISDLVVLNPRAHTYSVSMGQPLGKFGPVVSTFVMTRVPMAGALRDMNRDQILDLITVNDDQTVSTRIGNGDGTFQAPLAPHPLATQPANMALGDVDGDGHEDVVTTHPTARTITLLFGKGDGTFADSITLGFGDTTIPQDVVLADMNLDGVLDIVTHYGLDHAASLIHGSLTREFASGISIPLQVQGNSRSIAIGDLNQDGLPDIAVFDLFDNAIVLRLSAADGSFTIQRLAGAATLSTPDRLFIQDVNRDGLADLIIATRVGIAQILGRGGGMFEPIQVVQPGSASLASTELVNSPAARDPFLVSWDTLQGHLVSHFSSARFGLGRALSFATNQGSSIENVAAADVNHDGRMDFVTANSRSADLTLLLGRGNGEFDSIPLPLPDDVTPHDVAASDLNRDGHIDLVITTQLEHQFYAMFGHGDGTFARTQSYDFGQTAFFRLVAVGDLNGDSWPDLVINGRQQTQLSIWLGSEQGFVETLEGPQLDDNQEANRASLVDVNLDGALDILLPQMAPSFQYLGFSVFLGRGDGTFGTGTLIENSSMSASDLAIRDVNHDGFPDVITLQNAGRSVARFHGRGDGQFDEPVTMDAGTPSRHLVEVIDVTQDGYPDILAASNSRTISLLEGGPAGSFSSPLTLSWPIVLNQTRSIIGADMNSDGLQDLFVFASGMGIRLLAQDDDDGIRFWDGRQLIAGAFSSIDVDLRDADVRANRLDAWIDFNRDGDWNDAGEQVLDSYELGARSGIQSIHFRVPMDAVPGESYARFRLSTTGRLTPTGVADNGEVEDYQVWIQPEQRLDFGDAPASGQAPWPANYPTLAIVNGARHRIAEPRLGLEVDGEPDGQPREGVSGDDQRGLRDEDGVAFVSDILRAKEATKASVSVYASAESRLDAWIDFNRDGDWLDAGEQIFRNARLDAGMNRLMFVVPVTGTQVGETAARFRLSSSGGLAPTGLAWNGEVEDYIVNMLADAPDQLVEVRYTAETVKSRETLSVSHTGTHLHIQDSDGTVYTSPRVGPAGREFVIRVPSWDVAFEQPGWSLEAPVPRNGGLYQVLRHGRSKVFLDTPRHWQNPLHAWDVDASGSLEPMDALKIFNALNGGQPVDGNAKLPWPPTNAGSQYVYVDVSGDGYLTSADALIVINELHRSKRLVDQDDTEGNAEGEGSWAANSSGFAHPAQHEMGAWLRLPEKNRRPASVSTTSPVSREVRRVETAGFRHLSPATIPYAERPLLIREIDELFAADSASDAQRDWLEDFFMIRP